MAAVPVSRYAIPLPGDSPDIVIEGDFPVSEEDWQHMLAVLAAMKPGLVF